MHRAIKNPYWFTPSDRVDFLNQNLVISNSSVMEISYIGVIKRSDLENRDTQKM